MSVQLSLNLSIEFTPRAGDDDSRIAERFAAFHRANPHVYAELLRLARDRKGRGVRKLGIGALFEVIRWNETDTASRDFKLNNDYRSRYARMIDAEPDLAGIFDLRGLRA
jgi:hypothetical protein